MTHGWNPSEKAKEITDYLVELGYIDRVQKSVVQEFIQTKLEEK